MPRTAPPTVLSVFSGIGGLDLGLEAAGFRIIGSVEIDEVARRTLKANRDSWPQLAPHDVTELARTFRPEQLGIEVGELDVLAGAPPCQPFSRAAEWSPTARRGLDDERGLLIMDVLRLVALAQPKVVLLENVAGFVRGRTSVLPVLERALGPLNDETGEEYELDHRILDAHEYGVAQHRKRAIVVLSRVGPLRWPAPLPLTERPVAWDAIGGQIPDERVDARGSFLDLLPSIPEGWNYLWHTDRGGGLPLFGYRTRYWSFLLKLAKDRPSWTLAASPGPSTGPFHWESRPLTVTEMKLLQSFPADWTIEGTRREQIRQLGNATPPALGEALGRSIRSVLGHQQLGRLLFGFRREGSVPQPETIQPVPLRHMSLLGDHRAHPGSGRGPRPRKR